MTVVLATGEKNGYGWKRWDECFSATLCEEKSNQWIFSIIAELMVEVMVASTKKNNNLISVSSSANVIKVKEKRKKK